MLLLSFLFFFFNDTATTEIYTLSLHDALPIYLLATLLAPSRGGARVAGYDVARDGLAVRRRIGLVFQETTLDRDLTVRSEEHTSELQSRLHLVCRLLLEKKKDVLPADS